VHTRALIAPEDRERKVYFRRAVDNDAVHRADYCTSAALRD
jgi:hypothetical protein